MSKKPQKSKDLCSGCYNNVYNQGLHGSKECWSYKSAGRPIEVLMIPVDLRPPYNKDNYQYRLKCYNVQRYATVKPDSLTEEGYWRY